MDSQDSPEWAEKEVEAEWSDNDDILDFEEEGEADHCMIALPTSNLLLSGLASFTRTKVEG